MAPYIYKRNNEGIHIINVAKTWEKFMVAARIIAAIPNPKDILVSTFALSLNVFLPKASSAYPDLQVKWGDATFIDRLKQRIRLKSST
jgi:hypothetical protein